jgi:hypothetical protein
MKTGAKALLIPPFLVLVPLFCGAQCTNGTIACSQPDWHSIRRESRSGRGDAHE